MRNFMALLGQTSRPTVIVESLKTLEAILEFRTLSPPLEWPDRMPLVSSKFVVLWSSVEL